MRKLRTLLVKMVCALAGGLMLSACSSEEGGSQAMGGKGAVILDLAAETVFDTKTKAVDESTYLNGSSPCGLQGENLGCARPCGIGL